MKKIIIALIAILLLGVIYYVTLGSSQLVDEMKKELDYELHTLSDNGFSISDHVIQKRTEHFILKVEDPKKIVNYLIEHNVDINLEDIQLLQDQKIGIDLEYLPNSTDAVAANFYPVNLPRSVYENSQPEDKEMITRVEKMISDKVFLVHLNINKLKNGFDGYIQDINQTFTVDGNESTFLSQNWTFDGSIDGEEVTKISQKLERLNYQINNLVNVELNNLQTQIDSVNESNTTLHYSLTTFLLQGKGEEPFSAHLNGLQGSSEEVINHDILSNKTKFSVNLIDIQNSETHQKLEQLVLDSRINNLNLKALEQLKNFAQSDENESFDAFIPTLQTITQSGISMDINDISISSITENNETYNGLAFNAHAQVDKNFQWDTLDNNPMKLASLIELKATLTLSNKIAEIMAEDPNMLMFMMFITPKEENGNKIYEIDYSKGSLAVNGTPLL